MTDQHHAGGSAKRVLDVGQCNPDHARIRRLLSSCLDVSVDRAQTMDEALAAVREGSFDLVLVNRVFDRDGSEGLDFVRRLKADPATSRTSVMLVSNYEDAQDAAVKAGALCGFGKAELALPQTLDRLREALS